MALGYFKHAKNLTDTNSSNKNTYSPCVAAKMSYQNTSSPDPTLSQPQTLHPGVNIPFLNSKPQIDRHTTTTTTIWPGPPTLTHNPYS
jgi:hypothetical protein